MQQLREVRAYPGERAFGQRYFLDAPEPLPQSHESDNLLIYRVAPQSFKVVWAGTAVAARGAAAAAARRRREERRLRRSRRRRGSNGSGLDSAAAVAAAEAKEEAAEAAAEAAEAAKREAAKREAAAVFGGAAWGPLAVRPGRLNCFHCCVLFLYFVRRYKSGLLASVDLNDELDALLGKKGWI